jgi:3-hydroxyacyl-[acyl-carrier-protein] dehydratase
VNRFQFEFAVPADHPSFAGHFQGNPVVPGVLLLAAVLDALERSSGMHVSHLQRVKFLSVLRPGEAAQGTWEVEGVRASFRVTTQRAGVSEKVAEGAGTLHEKASP